MLNRIKDALAALRQKKSAIEFPTRTRAIDFLKIIDALGPDAYGEHIVAALNEQRTDGDGTWRPFTYWYVSQELRTLRQDQMIRVIEVYGDERPDEQRYLYVPTHIGMAVLRAHTKKHG